MRRLAGPWLAMLLLACSGCGATPAGSLAGSLDRPQLGIMDHRWSLALGGPTMATGVAAAVTEDESVIVAGTFEQTLPAGMHTVTSAGHSDAFAAALGPDGAPLWLQRWGGPGPDGASAAAAAGSRTALALWITPPAMLGDQPAPGMGQPDAAVVVLDARGRMAWMQWIRSSAHARIADMAMTEDGAVAVTGSFAGTVRIGQRVLTSAGASDVFVAWFAPDGSPAWAMRAGSTGADAGLGVALGPETVAVAGSFAGAVELDAERGAGPGGFVLSLGRGGQTRWLASLGEPAAAHAIAASAEGDLFVAGHFRGTVQLGQAELASQGSADVLVARLDSRGQPVWASALGGPGADHARDVALASGRVVLVGTFEGRALAGSRELTGSGATDGFAAVLGAADGAVVGVRTLGGPGQDSVGSAAVLPRGVLAITGSFETSLTLGGPGEISGQTHAAPGQCSAFAARFAL